MAMMDHELNIQRRQHGAVASLDLQGHLAALNVYKLKSVAEKLFESGSRHLIFELSGVSFLDSAGIGALVHVRNEAVRLGGSLTLVHSKFAQVHHAILSSPLGGLMPCHDTLEAALHELAAHHGIAVGHAAPPAAANPEALLAELIRLAERLALVEQRLEALERQRVN